jgi:malate dehydrogenase (oxaloacetate-decarboxylating)(NADP+)
VFAHEHEEMKNLEAIVQKIKPTALIGKCFSTLVPLI